MTDIKLSIKNLEIDFTLTDKLLTRWLEMTRAPKSTSEKREGKLRPDQVQQEIDQTVYTKDDLRSILSEIVKKLGRNAVVDLIKPFGGKLDLVHTDRYPELMASAREVLGD